MKQRPPRSALFPYTTLVRSQSLLGAAGTGQVVLDATAGGAAALPHDYLRNVMADQNGEPAAADPADPAHAALLDISEDRKSTRLNSSHANILYAVFCLKQKP